MLFQIKRLQKYHRSKLEVETKSAGSAGPARGGLESGRVDDFSFELQSSNFDL